MDYSVQVYLAGTDEEEVSHDFPIGDWTAIPRVGEILVFDTATVGADDRKVSTWKVVKVRHDLRTTRPKGNPTPLSGHTHEHFFGVFVEPM